MLRKWKRCPNVPAAPAAELRSGNLSIRRQIFGLDGAEGLRPRWNAGDANDGKLRRRRFHASSARSSRPATTKRRSSCAKPWRRGASASSPCAPTTRPASPRRMISTASWWPPASTRSLMTATRGVGSSSGRWICIPLASLQVIVGPRGIASGTVELKRRSTGEREELGLESSSGEAHDVKVTRRHAELVSASINYWTPRCT